MEQHRWSAVLAFALVLPLAACGGDDDTSGAAGEATTEPTDSAASPLAPELVEGECPAPIPRAEGFRCGTVAVPVERGIDGSPTLDLAVVVLPAPEPGLHDDPMVVIDRLEPTIAGYDGVAGLTGATGRDVVLFDVRGMGGSTPSLECHEIDYLSQFPDPDPARRQVFLDQLDACRERLEAEGVELPAYTIEAIAADVVDIRRALGYDRWNIVGYGAQTNDDPGVTSTEVVLELMRTDGDAIRSVTMEAPTPPQLDPWTTQLAGLARALDEVSMACQEQPPCAAARPDLGATLADALARPRTEHELTSGHGDPITVVMDPAWLSLYLWRGIASFEFLPHIPSLTGATPEELAAVVASTTSPPAPHDIGVHGVLLSALCPQTGAATSPEERGTDAGIGLEMWGTLVQADSCARWPSAEPDGALDEPVTSDIPTLVLVGQFDPNATAAGARLLASTLTTAQVYEVPGATANVLGHSDCAREIRNSFVSDPEREPDTTCLTAASPPRFTI